MAILRYDGHGLPSTTFQDVHYLAEVGDAVEQRTWRVGEVQSGEEFSVPDEIAERFFRRSDVELVSWTVEPKTDAEPETEPKSSVDAPPEDAAPAAEDQPAEPAN